MTEPLAYLPGQRVGHAAYGEGVVVAPERNGYVRAFFAGGERLVAVDALQAFQSRTDRVIGGSPRAMSGAGKRGWNTRHMPCLSWKARPR
jgi:hypothetical protein